MHLISSTDRIVSRPSLPVLFIRCSPYGFISCSPTEDTALAFCNNMG